MKSLRDHALTNASALDLDPSDVIVKREISRSEASSIYEAELSKKTIILKLVSIIRNLVDNANGSVSRQW